MRAILLDISEKIQLHEIEEKVWGYFGALVVLYMALHLIRRLVLGKSKTRLDPVADAGVRECGCGYYLAPSDKICPKCRAEVPPATPPA